MRYQIEIRASDPFSPSPDEWVAIRKPGGSTLKFDDASQAEHYLQQFQRTQPHVPARVTSTT